MRGARRQASPAHWDERIIPAYAGSTGAAALEGLASRDHPRVCGEHTSETSRSCLTMGSSPRMRGAQNNCKITFIVHGIIPAYAGSTKKGSKERRGSWDHPRVCGEHQALPPNQPAPAGSSPRMRGAPAWLDRNLPLIRIIPAYAGSTRRSAGWIPRRRDHPRVCGEHQSVKD